MLYNAGIAKYNRMIRDVTVHKTIRSNQDIVSNLYIAHYCSINTNPDLIPYHRCAFPCSTIFLPNSHAFMNIAIFP